MGEPPTDFLGDLPDRDALNAEAVQAVGRAIRNMEDLGLAPPTILYSLIYAGLVYILPQGQEPEEIAMALVGLAGQDLGCFCEPDVFRDAAHELERIAKETRAKKLRS